MVDDTQLPKKRRFSLGGLAIMLVLPLIVFGALVLFTLGKDHLRGGTTAPADFLNACLEGPLNGYVPIGGDARVQDLVDGIQGPAVTLRWERSDSGYILRKTIWDQMTNHDVPP